MEIAVGARIRTARVAAGMTQRALSDAVGIAYQKLQKYELGKDRIAISTLDRIAKALNIRVGSLFGDDASGPLNITFDAMVARRSIELVQVVNDERVVKQLAALIEELGDARWMQKGQALALPPEKAAGQQIVLLPAPPSADPMRAVIDPLLTMLRQVGTGDAGALARLLGRALAEAEKILNS